MIFRIFGSTLKPLNTYLHQLRVEVSDFDINVVYPVSKKYMCEGKIEPLTVHMNIYWTSSLKRWQQLWLPFFVVFLGHSTFSIGCKKWIGLKKKYFDNKWRLFPINVILKDFWICKYFNRRICKYFNKKAFSAVAFVCNRYLQIANVWQWQ